MIYRYLLCGLLSLMLLPLPVHAKYDHHDAERDCKRSITRDSRYRGLRDVHVEDRGRHRYYLTGKVRMDGDDGYFSCHVRDKRVVDWQVWGGGHGKQRYPRYDNGYNNGYDDRYRYNDGYAGHGGGYAYGGGHNRDYNDDQAALRTCRRAIRSQLDQDSGRVERLVFTDVYRDGRQLRGNGYVELDYRQHRRRSIAFRCQFERDGRLRGARYRYQ